MRPTALLAAVALAVLALPLGAGAQTTTTPATDTLFISAGCPQDTPGTCTSTRWLGKTPGNANTNFLTATTPVDEVLFRADGTINWRDYASDKSLPAAGYTIDATRPLELDLTVQNNALMANESFHARVTLRTADGKSVQLPAQRQERQLVAPQSAVTVEFDFDLPDTLQGVVVRSMTAEVAVHGVNAQGGYINQSGESEVRVPHLVTTTS
jgi:hypothetical protein